MNQTTRLIRFLRTNPGSTSLDITLGIGVVNVTGRVSDLRAQGYDVQVHRDREGTFRYRLIEQRELGRRVLARMLAGNAETFTAMATIMAQTAGKGLSSPAIRARVALVTELPIAHGIAESARNGAKPCSTAPRP